MGRFSCRGHGARQARRDAGIAAQGVHASVRVRSLHRRGQRPLVSADSFGFLFVAPSSADSPLARRRPLKTFASLPVEDRLNATGNGLLQVSISNNWKGAAKECRGRPQSPLPAHAGAEPSPPQRSAAGSASRRVRHAPRPPQGNLPVPGHPYGCREGRRFFAGFPKGQRPFGGSPEGSALWTMPHKKVPTTWPGLFVRLFLPVGGVLVGVLYGLLVEGINLVAGMGLAVGEVDAQLTLEVVGGDCIAIRIVMGHAVE